MTHSLIQDDTALTAEPILVENSFEEKRFTCFYIFLTLNSFLEKAVSISFKKVAKVIQNAHMAFRMSHERPTYLKIQIYSGRADRNCF